MFSKVLIANRGAIATRVERTLSRMGVQSVAVYSEADRDSLHVEQADEAICLGEGGAAQTYLDASKILEAARTTGAQAIHPGYGFLSENPDFARACGKAGITFIGPEPEQMETFGLKHVARRIAAEADVPLLSGTGLISDVAEALRAADEIGYPVMLKSTAGGGGIGMRICNGADELSSAFDAVIHLAEANFGDAGVFLEKYIAHARHVEVQIFGSDGDVVALGDRDCSVQRRNQKVVEEAPAPGIPNAVRSSIHACAERLATRVGYRNAGTVEFLYDEDDKRFYFLEVNTRLQVEHGITEECTGIDLVEWMVREAAGERDDVRLLAKPSQGHAIEVRIYAEDPANDFVPAGGRIDEVLFDERARVETWVRKGIEVTTMFDPMIAKIIVHAETRAEAVACMDDVLEHSRVYGIATNARYLQALMRYRRYLDAHIDTRMLDDFHPAEATIEVVDGGVQTTVQDYPGMVGYWMVGVPPCGPMDVYDFRLANALLGNDPSAPGLELTVRGGSYRFRTEVAFCLTGADMHPTLDGVPVDRYEVLSARRGQVLELGTCDAGMRSYLCVAGGLDVPLTLGSGSTFVDGGFGGHGGRALRAGDVIGLKEAAASQNAPFGRRLSESSRPEIGSEWTIGVLAGPLCTEEFLEPGYLDELCANHFEVGYDSARTGVRLNGPVPLWTREDGGEAGLHPSNVHDTPYSIGALDLTGDQPILLGPDGPSLGGFVCPVVVALSQRWKLGQLHPGDTVRFQVLQPEDAEALHKGMEADIASVCMAVDDLREHEVELDILPLPEVRESIDPCSAILHHSGEGDGELTVRRSGEDAILVEYGPMELSIAVRFRVHVLMQALQESGFPYIDITPGIRSLQVHFDPDVVTAAEIVNSVVTADAALPVLDDMRVPSRIVRLPLSWDDPQAQLAAHRYQETTRPDAPWCPSNLEFIRRINGLDSIQDVYDIVFGARYLVLGLGDVYLGAPVATPVDPRHRLVTTKYNPARPWTPENAVGIGGAYLCVYGMEGPGGYQLVGRTTQMWNPLQATDTFLSGKPWLLDFFDQLQFYPVSAEELLQMREDNLRGRFNVEIEETTFSLAEYQEFLDDNASSIATFKEHQEASFDAEHERWVEQGLDTFVSDAPQAPVLADFEIPDGCVVVQPSISGAVWKVLAQPGKRVSAGEDLMVLESMKMEFPVPVPCDCIVESVYATSGDLVGNGQTVACVRPVCE